MANTLLHVLILCCVVVSVTSQCNIMGITECNKVELVSSMKFHAFVPKDKYEQTCQDMRRVFECIYQPKYMDGCTLSQTYFYDMQREVSNEVCRKDGDYLQHVDCLGNSELESKIFSDCVANFNPDKGCETLMHARTCISTIILGKCGQDDSDYMDVLSYYFLGSFAKQKSCYLEMPRLLKATTMAPTTTTAAMSTTTTMPSNTTTAASSGFHVTPSVIFILALAKLVLGFRVWSL